MKVEAGMLDSFIGMTNPTAVDDVPLFAMDDLLLNAKSVKPERDDKKVVELPAISPGPDMSLCYVNTRLQMQTGELADLNTEIESSQTVGKQSESEPVAHKLSLPVAQEEHVVVSDVHATITDLPPHPVAPVTQDDVTFQTNLVRERMPLPTIQQLLAPPTIQHHVTTDISSFQSQIVTQESRQSSSQDVRLDSEDRAIVQPELARHEAVQRLVRDIGRVRPAGVSAQSESISIPARQQEIRNLLGEQDSFMPLIPNEALLTPIETTWTPQLIERPVRNDTNLAVSDNFGDERNRIQSAVKASLPPSAPESMPVADNLVNNVVDFFNRKLALPEPDHSKTPIDLRAGILQPTESKDQPTAFKYNPASLIRSINVDGYHAKINLHPGDLGHITADIQVTNGTTDLRLSTETIQVRQFIESHLQSLRDSFQTMNIQLGDVQVQHHASPGNPGDAQKRQGDAQQGSYRQDTPATQALQHHPRRSNSIVDTYA